LKDGSDFEPSMEDIIETVLSQTRMMVEELMRKRGIIEMRKHFGWYFRGFSEASILRKKLVLSETYNEVSGCWLSFARKRETFG
jgi:tRNA-dihydrouridine synthase B